MVFRERGSTEILTSGLKDLCKFGICQIKIFVCKRGSTEGYLKVAYNDFQHFSLVITILNNHYCNHLFWGGLLLNSNSMKQIPELCLTSHGNFFNLTIATI